MSNKVMILALAAAVLAMTSCDKNDNGAAANAKYITVNTSIGSLSRTVIDDKGEQKFAKDDKISVYSWTGTATAVNTDAMAVDNSINTYDGTSKWTAAPQMLWLDMKSAHYFLGVYPSKAISDFTADSYTLKVTDQEASDLLVAVNKGENNAGLTATAKAVTLQFDHVMAKLIVNLSFRDQWGGTPKVDSVITNYLKSKATVDYLAKQVTPTAAKADSIVLRAVNPNTSYQSIMVPQAGENAEIAIKIGGKRYTYTGNVKLESGKYTTVNLMVGRNAITLGSVSINDWGEGEKIEGGEAQED